MSKLDLSPDALKDRVVLTTVRQQGKRVSTVYTDGDIQYQDFSRIKAKEVVIKEATAYSLPFYNQKQNGQLVLVKLPARAATDFSVENHGSICLIRSSNQAVVDRFDEHVSEYQTMGTAVVVEPRYVSDIISGLEAAGFSN